MKKNNFFLLLLLFSVFLGCEKERDGIPLNSLNSEPDPLSVSENEASRVAYEVVNNSSVIRGGKLRIPDGKVKKIKEVKKQIDESDGQVLFYIFIYEESGFAIVSGDKRYSPILAISDNNSWESDSLGGIKEWLFITKKNIIRAKKEFTKPLPQIEKEWEIYNGNNVKKARPGIYCNTMPVTTETGRFVNDVAQWNQGGPFSFYSPSDNGCSCQRRPAGCGALAMAMIMKYYQFPLMTMSFNGESLYTDYSLMPIAHNYSCDYPDTGHKSAAMLTRLCGGFANSGYGVLGNCSTYTYWWNIKDAFVSMGYSNGGTWGSYDDKFWPMYNDLMAGKPVVFSGTLNMVNLNDWHIWVGDGIRTVSYEYEKSFQNEYGEMDVYCATWSTIYIGMNWGWGGSNNGYFLADGVFNTDEVGEANGTYDTYVRILTGIRP